jgi:hypothetical protein
MPPNEFAEVVQDWPQPGTGNDGPLFRYGRGPAILAYDTPDERVAVVTIPVCLQAVCGHPNDEVLTGHPLYGKGLAFYSVHRVQNSSRLAAMERANAVHDRHDPVAYLKNKEHWIFTFQDGTVEILALASEAGAMSYRLFDSWSEACQLIAASEA